VSLEVVPLADAAGCAVQLKVEGLEPGDQLVWTFGGARPEAGPRERWDPIMRGNPAICRTGDPRKPELRLSFIPADARGNHLVVRGPTFALADGEGVDLAAVGNADPGGRVIAADGSAWGSPAALIASSAADLPVAAGIIDLNPGDEVCWAVRVTAETGATEVQPRRLFAEGQAYLASCERVEVSTPEPRLDAAMAAVCHAIDAACDPHPTLFRHGCMAFHIHFVGWRVICGSTALGWHDRVRGNALHYLAGQVRDDLVRTLPSSDPECRLCHEGPDSRLFGRGRLADSPRLYDTQTQFFDQTIRDWRATADPELEAALGPGLELQLEWSRECFDPDGDGLYESYINTLPTDSVWYSGGGSVEQSAYTYAGHLAAADLARRVGDEDSAARHREQAVKIRRAVRTTLWLPERGHYGAYVEQGGLGRVHPDAWTYSQFLAIDAGLATPEEALQALYYTEWGLERTVLPYGGKLCQLSSWVPWKWSVRDVFCGDLWHLALAYCQSGLADEGWELLLGGLLDSGYAGAVPGGFSHVGAGTDFSDCTNTFARAVVEGVFGYCPDYPNDRVTVRPCFPSTWPRASIRTPDFELVFTRNEDTDQYRLRLTREASVELRLPVRAEGITRVLLDGQPIPWSVEPGPGHAVLVLRSAGPLATANLEIGLVGRVTQATPSSCRGAVGQIVQLAVPRGRLESWQDLHGVLLDARSDGRTLTGHLASRAGHHLVLAEVTVGELPQRQVFKVEIDDPQTETAQAARTPRQAPRAAAWECLDLAAVRNGEIQAIFRQQYLSPRPRTCSVRVGTDGYSAWTFPHWGESPPEIDLSCLPRLTRADGRVWTPQQVPFAGLPTTRNTALVSRWDNWPGSVTVPVGRSAEAVWLLIAGSTFPMQTGIANAEVRFDYGDGEAERLELVPPRNYWILCPWGGYDYDEELDRFALPVVRPPMVWLGRNCRAMVLSWRLRPGIELSRLTLTALSQEVVVALLGVSLMNPGQAPR
jgi:hypothetical protein